jgi:hypothetical protein
MDVSELRKRILRALDDAGRNAAASRDGTDATARRAERDAARDAWDQVLSSVIVPVLRQAQGILKAEGQSFTVHAPAGGARIASDASADTFVEFELDLSGPRPLVLGRSSSTRGRQRMIVEERPIAETKGVADLVDDDVAAFLVAELPRLIARR